MHKDNSQYISLKQASDFSDYSQDYLSLRARQGKLKAVKLGRNWVTTRQWLDEYVNKAEAYKEEHNGNWVNHVEKSKSTRDITYKRPVLSHAIIAVAILVFILFSGGVAMGYYGNSILKPLSSVVNTSISSIGLGVNEVAEDISESQTFQYASNSVKYAFEYVDGYIEYLPKTKAGQYVIENIKDVNEKIVIGANIISNKISKTKFAKYAKEVFQYVNEEAIVFINIISEKVLNNKLFANIEIPDYIKSSISENIKNFKKFAGEITGKIFYPIKRGYEFVIRPWKIMPSLEFGLFQEMFEENEGRISNIKTELENLREKGIVAKELVKEVSKITQIEPVKEITKQIIKIDGKELEKLKAEISSIKKWEDDIKNLQILTTKLKTNPPYTQITTAPVYIPSQGLQVDGVGIFSSLGVSGSAGITNLGVGGSTSLGSNSSDKLTVNATSDFLSSVSVRGNFTVGDSTNYLTIDSTGNLNTTGDVTVNGNLTVAGAQTYSGAAAFTASSTSAALSVNQTGSGDIVNFQDSGTTVFAISDGGNITMTGSVTTTGSIYAETYYSTTTDSTVRKTGEEILRASVSIYRYEMPSQTGTTTYFRISKYFTNNPLSSSPTVLPGATRVYRLIVKYSDDIATTSNSSWRIYRTSAATTSDTFSLSGLAEAEITEGTPYLTDVLTIPDTDWQLEMKLPSVSNQIRIFQIYLSAYDQIN
jgi:hypothetical protein